MKDRKGSALLIVLGMLSFMVVSAVGFAMFMRESRTPSSYLRRNSAARYLLKAALANAIARIDGQLATERQIGNSNLGDSAEGGYCEGVFDDPYPGVGPTQGGNNQRDRDRNISADARNGNLWTKRVFTPFGLVSPDKTVSTLTLEGLAYLPPAIINEARVFSRMSRTAMWRNLSYDAGRYAFTAVDVSDCFDVNKVLAGERRTSAPNQRVNLSSLFPNNGVQLDNILTQWESSEIPFVSIADYNIVAGNSTFAPFYRYIGTSGAEIYNVGDHQSISNALFITDTWFPPTNFVNETVKRYDLAAGGNSQPFRSFNESANFLETARAQTDVCRVLMRNIGGVGLACLYDYLDKNDRPISFVVPTVETVPMVVGIGVAHNNKFSPRVTTDGPVVYGAETAAPPVPNATPTGQGYVYRWAAQKYSLKKLCDQMMLTGVVTYPFKRTKTRNYPGTFTGEALVKIFMGPKTMKSRLDAGSPLAPLRTSDWQSGVSEGVVSIKCSLNQISFNTDITSTDQAVKQFTAQINSQSVNAPVFWRVWQQYKDPNTEPPMPDFVDCAGGEFHSLDGIRDDGNALKPRNEDGQVIDWWLNAQVGGAAPAAGGPCPTRAALGGTEFVPHILVWVRIINGDGKTVDIVPARIEDDGIWGGSAFNAQGMANKFGDGTPVIEIRGDESRAFKYDDSIVQKLDGSTPETFPLWSKFYAVDPRYNHAPENWFAMDGNGEVTAAEWLKAIGAEPGAGNGGLLGTNGRDHDIFMFTSDQEYMQSIGELQFLPDVQDMDGSGDFFENDYLNGCTFNGNDFSRRKFSAGATLSSGDMNKFASGNFMWRTYTAFNNGNNYVHPIYSLRDGATPVEIISGSGDFRVNPFSPDSRVLMAALKDTPFDYSVASTNEQRNQTLNLQASQRNRYAFCANSSVARLDDDELLDIADVMCEKFGSWARSYSHNRTDWEAAMRDMLWRDVDNRCNDEQLSLFGLEDFQRPLHGVDRKFLFSFWHDCFQNRQQLFLVFIRAEPLTVGGMGAGSLASAQLGARGVALVWRDPVPPAGTGTRPQRESLTSPDQWKRFFENHAPHRTRVLFYHQFD